MKKIFYIFIVILCCSLALIELVKYSKNYMEFSLVEIIISVRNKNEEKFHEYVDLDKVVHLAVDNFVDEKRKLNVEEMKKIFRIYKEVLGSNSLIFLASN